MSDNFLNIFIPIQMPSKYYLKMKSSHIDMVISPPPHYLILALKIKPNHIPMLINPPTSPLSYNTLVSRPHLFPI